MKNITKLLTVKIHTSHDGIRAAAISDHAMVHRG